MLRRRVGEFVMPGRGLAACTGERSTHHPLHRAFFADIDAALERCPEVMDVGFAIEVAETGPP